MQLPAHLEAVCVEGDVDVSAAALPVVVQRPSQEARVRVVPVVLVPGDVPRPASIITIYSISSTGSSSTAQAM
jgi:hypothetical protein